MKNLILLSRFLKENFDKVQRYLDMESFVEGDRPIHEVSEHDCGTTACLIGWGVVSGIPELSGEGYKSWWAYIRGTYGLHSRNDNVLLFLFDWRWSSDLTQGIARLDYYIEHGEVHPDFEELEYGLVLPTTKE